MSAWLPLFFIGLICGSFAKETESKPLFVRIRASNNNQNNPNDEDPVQNAINTQTKCFEAIQAMNGNKTTGCSATQDAVVADAKAREQSMLNEMGFGGGLKEPTGPAPTFNLSEKWIPSGETTTIPDLNKKNLLLSAVTPTEADRLAKELYEDNRSIMRLDKRQSGCAPRAHFLAMELRRRSIEAGKIWIKGLGSLDPLVGDAKIRSETNWNYHVAVFLMVRTSNGYEKRVIDPMVNPGRALPYNEYLSKLSSTNASRLTVEFSSRYPYEYKEHWSDKIDRDSDRRNTRAKADLGCIVKDIREGTRGCISIDDR